MATRSTIAMELDDGKIYQVYCHWDGYLDNNGKILLEHYADENKALELITNGDISSLGTEVGEKHDFNARYDRTDPRDTWTKYYGRDRGETDVGFKTFKDFKDYKDNHQYEEYEYIRRKDGTWFVSYYDNDYKPLIDAIADELIEKEMAEDE